MEIRLWESRDTEGALVLLKEFHKESLDKYGFFCNDVIALKVLHTFEGVSLVMYMGDELVGVLAGKFSVYPGNDERLYQEVLWFVKKEHRKHSSKMIDALEYQCRDWGIGKVVMSYFGHINLDRYYKQRGYEFLEAHYIKSLN